jgi:NTE family protein
VITGTSIGAVVGGAYAAGYLDAFENWARGLTRGRVFGYLDFGFSGSGLIGGNRLADELVREIGDITFPGIFPPHKIGGRWLMDGGLVNPVPVSAARSLGARLVIAVNLNADNFGRGTVIQSHGPDLTDELMVNTAATSETLRGRAEQLFKRRLFGSPNKPGLSTVMVDAFNIALDRITRARLAGDPPDALIAPRLSRFGVFDFHRADEAIQLGSEATEKCLENIAEAIEALA